MCVVIKDKGVEGVCVSDGGRGRESVCDFATIYFFSSYIRVLHKGQVKQPFCTYLM